MAHTPEVKYKLMGGYCPEYAHKGDAGCDLRCPARTVVRAHAVEVLPMGIALEIPRGCYGMVCSRAGAATAGLVVQGGVAVIDSTYRGEIKVALRNETDEPIILPPGARVAQVLFNHIMPASLVPADELGETERGDSGRGGSGLW